jgi:hypothetical protein
VRQVTHLKFTGFGHEAPLIESIEPI